MASYSQSVADVAVTSSWTKSGGKITGQTTGTATRSVTVTVPAGETLQSVQLALTTSSTAGGAAILTVGGVAVKTLTTQTITLDIGAGTSEIAFVFKDYGNVSWSSTLCTMHFTAMTLTVTTVTEEEEEEEDPAVQPVKVTPENAIVVYDAFEKSYTAGLGLAVLTPTACDITEEAGGNYALSLTHPLTPDGRWQHIQPMAIISAPVPVQLTPLISAEENAIVTGEYDVYTANQGARFFTSKAGTYYPAWVATTYYQVGDKVRHGGVNWVCSIANAANPWDDRYWTSRGTGAPTPTKTIPAGKRVAVTSVDGSWRQVKLPSGEMGWMLIDDLTFYAQAGEWIGDPEEIAARRIAVQAFRVTSVSIDSAGGQLTAQALHISYDASSLFLDSTAAVENLTVPDAVLTIRAACIPDGTSSAPNVYSQFAGREVSGEWTHKSFVEALLDPDSGLVGQTGAMLLRDNADFFILADAATDRGVRLRYGSNLIGVKWNRDWSKVITRVIPVAKDEDGAPLYCDPPCVDSPNVKKYPYPLAEVLSVDGQVGKEVSSDDSTLWTAETLRAHMAEEAQQRYERDLCDLPDISLDVDFVMLGDTEEFSQYKPLERLQLYDAVSVWDPVIGLDVTLRVRSYSWDAIRRRYKKITLSSVLGGTRQIMPGYALLDGTITPRKLSPETRGALGL